MLRDSITSIPGALREAPRRLSELAGRLWDGSTSAPGDLQTPRERSRRLKTASRAFLKVSRRLQEQSRGPKSALGGFTTTHTGVQAFQSGSFLKSTFAPSRSIHRASSSLLEQFRASSNRLSVTQSERSEKQLKRLRAWLCTGPHEYICIYIYIYIE